MTRYRIQLLGTHAILTADGAPVDFPFGKPFALLSYLLLTGRGASRAALAGLLWSDRPRERGLQSVRQALLVIRRALGEDVVRGDDPVTVNADVVWSDIGELRRALRAADVEAVHGLWRGAPLERFPALPEAGWERALEEARQELQQSAAAALARAADQAASGGDVEAALRHLGKGLEVDPYTFELRTRRIELLVRAGHRTEAERSLEQTRGEYGDAEFAPALDRLEQRVQELRRTGGEGVAALLNPELVGRGEELALLNRLWQQARQARTQRVLLTGASGVGKTRLAQELSRNAAMDGGRTVVVKPAEPERTLAWGAITTLVNRLLDLPGAAGINAASDAVLRRVVPSRARAEHTVGVLEAAPLADALVDLIGAVAYESPLIIVLEDVQWADAPSWMLLSRLMTQIEGEAVLFVLTVRDGEMDAETRRALRRFMQASGTRSIGLGNFSSAETAEFLAYNAGLQQSDAAPERLHVLTRGNPLFLVEVLKMLRDQGALEQSDGRWTLDTARLPERLQLPDSVQGVLATRIERLTPSARRVAEVLAGGRSVVTYEEVRRGATLTDAATAAAIAELIERGVAVRAEGGYALAHDQLGTALRRRPARRDPRVLWSAAAAALVLVLAAVWLLPRVFAPRYGGGVLYVAVGDSVLQMTPPRGLAGEWELGAARIRVPRIKVARGPFFDVRGSVQWYADIASEDDSPFVVRMHGDSASAPLAIGRTDHGTFGISPDGGHLLFIRDNPATPQYDVRVLHKPVQGGRETLVFQTSEKSGGAWWSPDGLRIAVISTAREDTLYVLTPGGGRLWSFAARTIEAAAWCSDSRRLLALTPGQAGQRITVLDVVSGTVRRVPGDEVVGSPLQCSPDGRHALARDAIAGVLHYVIIDLESGQRRDVLPVGFKRHLVWIPPRPVRVAHRLELDRERAELRVGEQTRVSAALRQLPAGVRTVQPVWESAQPEIAAMLPDGTLIGNRAGRTVVRARYADWLTDTLVVTVRGEAAGTLLLDEPFASLDTSVWIDVGYPLSRVVEVAGERALLLDGDGNYSDGVISAREFRLAHGATLEMEVRLHPNRDYWQKVVGALCDIEPPVYSSGRPLNSQWTLREQMSWFYPAWEQSKSDLTEIGLGLLDYGMAVRVPQHLPTDGWFHIALQAGPDGFMSLFLNRERVAVSRVRDPHFTTRDFRICIYGASVGAQALVRNVRLWPGTRY